MITVHTCVNPFIVILQDNELCTTRSHIFTLYFRRVVCTFVGYCGECRKPRRLSGKTCGANNSYKAMSRCIPWHGTPLSSVLPNSER